jgi:hypothetical protein
VWLLLAFLVPFLLVGLAVTAEHVARRSASEFRIGRVAFLVSAGVGAACLLKGFPKWRVLAVLIYLPVVLSLLVAFVLWMNGALFDLWL